MFYYEVIPGSSQFHGKTALTYCSSLELPIGSVVVVPLRRASVLGVVVAKVEKPKFATKEIAKPVIKEPIPGELIKLLGWLAGYYPAPLGSLAQLLLPGGLLRKRELAAPLGLSAAKHLKPLPPLTKEQLAAIEIIDTPGANSALLHGDTGSGKTRVYLELAQQTLAKGRSVLLLTPEIGLTPQLEERVKNSLDAPVIIVHSQLTPAAKRAVWLQIIQANQPVVVIGPRSALFTPISKLGLIVIDEAHDQAYKQEQLPHYVTARVAARLAELHGARLLQGTATPLISDYYLASVKKAPIARLTERPAGDHTDRQITVVDLRNRQQFSRQPHLSNELLGAIQQALSQRQMSLVFLNRRGTARVVLCQICGWQATCPTCDLPLTFHGDAHQLRCHTCGYSQNAPSNCPSCGSADIIFKSIGTKALVDELQAVFPEAKIGRFDTDNLKADRLEQQYKKIAAGELDILVGTQLLAKGLDLPKLTVVGIAVADTSLYLPDYTADEHTFQLLTQVIGRVGRGHAHGQVIIQTYAPENLAIQAVVRQDWPNFYQKELSERQRYDFPPFYHLLKLSCSRASSKSAQTAANRLAEMLHSSNLRLKIGQPTASFFEKIGGRYHWQIILRAKDRSELLKATKLLPSGWSFNLDPSNLL